jgi:hypothetical protein
MIKIKFQPNEIIYFFNKDKLEKGIIIDIEINIKKNSKDIKYNVLCEKHKNTHFNYLKLNEDNIFRNLKEINKYIKKQYDLL